MMRHFRELSVALALGLSLLFLAVAAPAFYQPQPLLSLLTREAPALVVACGMGLVIIGRQIDISVGSQFAVCSVCAGLLAAMNWPLVLVLPASVALGASMGALNGALVADCACRRLSSRSPRWSRGARDSAGCVRDNSSICPTGCNGSA